MEHYAATALWDPVIPAVNAKSVQVFAAPVESDEESVVEFREAGSLVISRNLQTSGLTPQSTTRNWIGFR
jgi:hypothetical protein